MGNDEKDKERLDALERDLKESREEEVQAAKRVLCYLSPFLLVIGLMFTEMLTGLRAISPVFLFFSLPFFLLLAAPSAWALNQTKKRNHAARAAAIETLRERTSK